ncbi:hypothetical protein HanRHA438_Chr12g0559411 [Helianthus annuus]|uniref:Uncharacterized protein n=2 Tax=Helianthus annuus TaxID=4232 RepID=A0A251T707_HELAN|nr:hypothetical protein HanXRQr2_Chr12g0547991 [Helianthus annuus]KAJ0489878.1 hypothetical protein HanHA300_Chr12g0448971 [Helianthus annuus]KAJ0493897.1 hypothetical protein HanIR_Chr12g0591261 [Helianthus annuus]KAJ0505789.1 hypothetical protein HanHA89_Chr12g0474451 [Helianthus annuus]KAJ0675459.1 hypothetical protein HanLR1_Chr12g0451401 [Helianthus annuus]
MKPQMKSPSPSLAVDFNYDSTATSPYATAPSSPQSTIPFFWEHKPGIPKQNHHDTFTFPLEYDTDFAFGYLERHSISAADDLFDCGKIKPLKPPPRLHCSNTSPTPSKPPKLRLKDALSPRTKSNDFDPFSEAFKQTPCEQTQRGRNPTTKTIRHKVSRSLSPFRVPGIVNNRKNSSDDSPAVGLTWYNKWNLKNLLLFRSGSEGSVIKTEDPLNKYTVLEKNETMKVPYKSGLMGCLRFNQNAGCVMKE